MQLLFATSNPAKYTAMQDALRTLGITLLCLKDMEQVPVAPEEGSSPLENARQKALFYYDHYGIPLFSCDSGLYLENLPQELQPGLHVRSPQGVYLDDQPCRTTMEDWQPATGISLPDITMLSVWSWTGNISMSPWTRAWPVSVSCSPLSPIRYYVRAFLWTAFLKRWTRGNIIMT